MTRFNQINARSAALSLSIAALALVVTTNAGHAQSAQKNGLKINAGQIATRQIVVEKANGTIGSKKVAPQFLPPKAETAKNPNIGNGGNGGGTGTVFFVPPKAEPVKNPNPSGPVTAQFVPPKAEPVKTGGNGGGQVLKFEAPKAPRVTAEPKVQVASNTPATQITAAPVAAPAAVAPTTEVKAEGAPTPAPAATVVAQPKVVVTVPQGYYYNGYVPAQRYYGSYGGGSSYKRCH